MTRLDYKQWVDKNFTFLAISDAYSLIDYIFEKGFEEIEDKIQELELIIKGKDVIIESMAHGKSCENCTYFDGLACMINNNCFRFNSDYEDSFEPKVNQDVK